MRKISRRAVKGADYNPRTISTEARRKLKKNLERVGLLGPIVWNEVTGNIVSGHQRVNVMDDLYGRDDYTLNVAVVQLDEKTEREQNVFFNNPEAMGDWDMGKLKSMFDLGMEVEATGFDIGDVVDAFGSEQLNSPDLDALNARLDALNKADGGGEQMKGLRNDVDYYVVAVFKSSDEADEFLKGLGIPASRYVNGERLREVIRSKSEPKT